MKTNITIYNTITNYETVQCCGKVKHCMGKAMVRFRMALTILNKEWKFSFQTHNGLLPGQS